MSFRINKSNLIKSKSLGALDLSNDSDYIQSNKKNCNYSFDGHSQIYSSPEVCDVSARRSYALIDVHLDSGFHNLETNERSRHKDTFTALELKVEKLIDILQDQQHLLQGLKDEIFILKSDAAKNYTQKVKEWEGRLEESKGTNKEGKILLDAIELKQTKCIQTDLKDILFDYLKTDDLKNHLAVTVVERVKEVVRQCLTETFRQIYLPFLERSQRRLLGNVSRTLHNAVNELEKKSNNLYKSVHKSSRRFQFSIDRRLVTLESDRPDTAFKNLETNLETILKTELTEWSKSTLMPQFLLVSQYEKGYIENESPVVTPSRPSPSAAPIQFTIDQLMTSALISRQIQKGEINKAFEEALSSSDLSLVMVACRAAEQHRVFYPCTLKQPVLLALIQQLTTDMVHDTQLKCRYLEDALLNLDVSDKVTRTYLPLVVNEIRKHLSKFLHSYPSHVAGRRIMLILMVADSLLCKW